MRLPEKALPPQSPGATQGSLPSRGSLFGFEVRSSLTFNYLRRGAGDPLTVTETDRLVPGNGDPLLTWPLRTDNPFEGRLYEHNGGYVLWTNDAGWFGITPEPASIAMAGRVDRAQREARMWGIPAMLCIIARGDVPVHASAVEVGGQALLFAAPRQHGKTTLAAAFLVAGHRVLSEDMSCLRPEPLPYVLPGPALLRVRPDTYRRLSLPATYPVVHHPDRVHLALEDARRGDADPVPLRGIVFLREASGTPRVEPVDTTAALPDLWALSFKLPTDIGRAHSFQAISALAGRVGLWNLYRELSYEQLPRVVDDVVSTCLST